MMNKPITNSKPTEQAERCQALLTEEIKRKYGKRIKKNPFRNNRVI